MSWIIAAMPLWFIGVMLSAPGAVAVCKIVGKHGEVTDHDIRIFVVGSSMIAVGAAFLYVAAKVAA